ncbi:hypothetical protein RR46_07105 [Papilio xuthus]|uniref:Uncharacterized protein n=1 Tax=Papilio xuthus TaxID=66420 RepID=A0A194Q683_PAPXU|nr:hypothetical protein RR46_07105 [Papilio xuthus]
MVKEIVDFLSLLSVRYDEFDIRSLKLKIDKHYDDEDQKDTVLDITVNYCKDKEENADNKLERNTDNIFDNGNTENTDDTAILSDIDVNSKPSVVFIDLPRNGEELYNYLKKKRDIFVIFIIITYVNAKPMEDLNEDQIKDVKETKLSSYIENFKTTISENVDKEYINLSKQDKEEVNRNLDEFVEKFTEDLIEVFSDKDIKLGINTKKRIDGLSKLDQDIKTTVLREFPDTDDVTADEIVAYSSSMYSFLPIMHGQLKNCSAKKMSPYQSCQQQFKLVTYVENFKRILSEYVKEVYNNLTINEMKTVNTILEDFFKNFTNDLRDILNGNKVDIDLNEKIEDGLPNDHFEVIKDKVQEEFKNINNETTDKIVYLLRKDLFMTRRLLDNLIEESKNAFEINSH